MEQSNQITAELFPVLAHSFQYIYQHEFSNLLVRMNMEQAALEKLDKSKSDFISLAAHELKTPLTLLEGYTSMMREIVEQKQIYDQGYDQGCCCYNTKVLIGYKITKNKHGE